MRGSFGIGQGNRNEERSGSRKEIRDFRIAASDCGRAKHEAIRRLMQKKKRGAIGKRPACMRRSFGIGQGNRNEERSGSRKEIRDFRIAASDCERAKHEAIRRLMQKKKRGVIGKRPACMRGSFGIGQGKRNEERSNENYAREARQDFDLRSSFSAFPMRCPPLPSAFSS